MQQFNVDELKPHPRNSEFFDDISGEKWNEFLKSIESRGVIEPIVITPDKIIVSGHQRVRACKELGIAKVMCDVHTYDNDDQILQDLLETNIRQRGDVGGSAQKVGKRIKELERIYGIRNGASQFQGNQYSQVEPKKSAPLTQRDLAKQLGISLDTLQNYKQLANMIPELSDLVDTGIVTKTTALAIMKQLSPQEQKAFISGLDVTDEIAEEKIEASGKKYTQRDIQKYIDDYKREKSRADNLEMNPKVVTETVTIKEVPSDYEDTKRELEHYKKDCKNIESLLKKETAKNQKLNEQLKEKEEKENSSLVQFQQELKDQTLFFCAKVANFLEEVGGYGWITDHINELPDYERRSYISAAKSVNDWANVIISNIKY